MAQSEIPSRNGATQRERPGRAGRPRVRPDRSCREAHPLTPVKNKTTGLPIGYPGGTHAEERSPIGRLKIGMVVEKMDRSWLEHSLPRQQEDDHLRRADQGSPRVRNPRSLYRYRRRRGRRDARSSPRADGSRRSPAGGGLRCRRSCDTRRRPSGRRRTSPGTSCRTFASERTSKAKRWGAWSGRWSTASSGMRTPSRA